MALLEQAHAALAGQACALVGENLVVGIFFVLSFALKKFSVLRLDLLEQAHAALAGQACALVGRILLLGFFSF